MVVVSFQPPFQLFFVVGEMIRPSSARMSLTRAHRSSKLHEAAPPILSRLSASLVVLRESPAGGSGFEVLMVQRGHNMSFAKSSWVFPGGVYDSADGNGVQDGLTLANDIDVLRTVALRECFEETGMLPIESTDCTSAISKDIWAEWRARVRSDASQWRELCASLGARFAALEPLCCFLTPQFEAERSRRRFLTQFFLCRAPTPAPTLTQVPMSAAPWGEIAADEGETVQAAWMSPATAIGLARNGKLVMFPPQLYMLWRLSEFHTADEALAGAKAFACGPRGAGQGLSIVMEPEAAGEGVLSLPFDEAHKEAPGAPGARHRIVGWDLKHKRGSTMSVELNDAAAHFVCGKKEVTK